MSLSPVKDLRNSIEDQELGSTHRLTVEYAGSALGSQLDFTRITRQTSLVVPLGALLPGMYQRAVVLNSGIAPERVRGQNHLYRGVSAAVAGRITYLLEN